MKKRYVIKNIGAVEVSEMRDFAAAYQYLIVFKFMYKNNPVAFHLPYEQEEERESMYQMLTDYVVAQIISDYVMVHLQGY